MNPKIERNVNGNICSKIWYKNKNDIFHREDGPAIIRYFPTGEIEEEQYCINNLWRREDGPALIYYYKSGQIKSEYYYVDDMYHREDGPAEIIYNKYGEIISVNYFLFGEKFESLKELQDYNKTIILK